MRYLILSAIAILIAGNAFAQYPTVQLVSSTPQYGEFTNVEQLVAAGNKVYFIATDTTHGTELFSITETGQPQLELDIMPGKRSGASFTFFAKGIAHMGAIGNNIYFMGLRQNVIGSSPALLGYDGNTLTVVDSQFTSIETYRTQDNKLYVYGTRDGTRGIYEVDPTTNTTTLLMTTKPEEWIKVNNQIYYFLTSFNQGVFRVHNIDTWVDTLIRDNNQPIKIIGMFKAGNDIGLISDLSSSANIDIQFWIWDGNTIDKHPIPQLNNFISFQPKLIQPTYRNGEIYFKGKDTTASKQGVEGIWRYNITTKQAVLLTDSIDGQNYTQKMKNLYPTDIYFFNDEIIFSGNGSNTQTDYNEFCTYNKNTGATTLYNISRDILTTDPYDFVTLGDVVYFKVTRPDNNTPQLYRYNPKELSVNKAFATPLAVIAYPNPTTANTTLELQLDKAKSLSIKLTDITGRTVHTIPTAEYATGKHNVTLPMEQLPNGNYFYSIIDNNGILLISGKLIKE